LDSLEAVYAAADTKWEASSAPETPSSPEPASSDAPVVDPATPAGTNPAEAAPAVPPVVEGTNPEKPAVAVEPTPFEKWVAKYGDQNKAAEEAWATNTRAAELARENAELKAKLTQPGGSNPPAPEVQPEAVAPTPVIEAAPEQVQQWANQYVAQDQACLKLDQSYRENAARLTVLTDPNSPESHIAAAKEVQKLQAWLQFPQVAEDEFAKANIQSQLANARAEYQARKLEAQGLDLENRDIRTQFEQRKGEYVSRINQHYANQKREYEAQQETQQLITRHATELNTAWGPAVSRTVAQFQIPESEIEDFKADLRTEAMATLEAGIKVEDLDAFMGKHAKRLMDRLDRNHRTKSAEYARLATQRAASQAPVPSVVPQVQPSTGDPLEDVYARVALNWKQASR
jgi:hypothetical protein